MRSQYRLPIIIASAVAGFSLLLYQAARSPGNFANATYLAALIVLEVVLASLWRFEQVFFPVTMVCFLLAATGLPLSQASTTIRWIFLGVGALAGLIVWVRSNRAQHFEAFHLVALFCVLSALASASASTAATTGLLKASSLLLLFLYAATGGRAAVAGRERAFVRSLMTGCEVLVFMVSAAYFSSYNVFGNPNNLGAFIGVIAVPVLLWAALVAENAWERNRRYIALAFCAFVLYGSVCRAAIATDILLVIVLAIALRRPRLLLRAVFAGALFLEIMAVANPTHMTQFMNSLSGKFIFKKGRPGAPGILSSRKTPWEDTMSSVKQHPWFGTGFGTSDLEGLDGVDPNIGRSAVETAEGTNREHGSSYLALAEYMGLLGILPFLLLLTLLVRAIARVLMWMRRTHSPFHYAVPFMLIAVAGLIHAGFEDWLFAAGSYLCVFFWVSAFLLIDLSSPAGAAPMPAIQPDRACPQTAGLRRSASV